MLDAYTVRKAIPRILIAVIGINLSIYLCIAMVDVTNIIGNGLGNLLTEPFIGDQNSEFRRIALANNVSNNIAGVFAILSLIGVGAASIFATGTVAIVLLSVLVPFIISMALITLAVLFTLVIRQALLIFLIVVSPVAIALFVLPGTEKYFKKWLDLFVKTLMVYPIIAVIFAMSTVLATILLGTAALSPGAIGTAKILGAVIVVFAPLVMIPFAFKLAGGAISAVMNVAGGRSANLSGRASKGFQNMRQNPNSFIGGIERDIRKNRTDTRANMYNRNVERTGVRGAVGRFVGGKRSSNIQAAENKESSDRVLATSETGNDAYVRAATLDTDWIDANAPDRRREVMDANGNGTGRHEYMTSTGQWFSEGQIGAARSQFKTAGDLAAAHKLVMSKTENVPPENQHMIMDDYVAYANRTGMDTGHAAGNWAGVAIPNQRMRADLRHSTIQRNATTGQLERRVNDDGLLDFMATNQGYALASQGEGTFETTAQSYGREIQRVAGLRQTANAAQGPDRDRLQRQADQASDRLHNSKENLRKFVADPTSGMTPAQIAQYQQQAQQQAGGATSQPSGQSPYGASSSASYKVAQAAALALQEIDTIDRQYAGPAGLAGGPDPSRDYSGGNQGDR